MDFNGDCFPSPFKKGPIFSLLPCEVSPVLLRDGVPLDVVREGDQGGVVDPDLVTFEDLGSAAFLTTRPAAVTFPIAELVGRNLQLMAVRSLSSLSPCSVDSHCSGLAL